MQVFEAYTGNCYEMSSNYESLSAIANDILEKVGLDPAQQLLLIDPSGNRLRLETAVEGQRVYVYDKGLITEELEQQAAPNFRQIDTPPDGVKARGEWAHSCIKFIKEPLEYIQKTRKSIGIIISAADLAQVHMKVHLKSLRRSRDKKRAAFSQVVDDLATCRNWEDQWNASERVSGLGAKMKILDKATVKLAWEMANKAAQDIECIFQSINIDQDPVLPESPGTNATDETILQVDMKALCSKIIEDANTFKESVGAEDNQSVATIKEAQHEIINEILEIHKESIQLAQSVHTQLLKTQRFLIQALRLISKVQTRSAKSKGSLAEISNKIHDVDENKAEVAKVIDFPFIYGVGLIEISRRQSWSAAIHHLTNTALSHFDQLRKNEYERIDRWTSRYSSLNMLDKIVKVDVKLPLVTMNFQELSYEDCPDIYEYLESLKAEGFGEIANELRSELEAMSQQLEKSFRATSKAQTLFPDINASQIIREEQQARMKSSALLDKQTRDNLERKLREKIEKETRVKLEAELRGTIEQEVRAELEGEQMQPSANLHGKLATDVQESVMIDVVEKINELKSANEKLEYRILQMEDEHSNEIAELQEQINATANKEIDSVKNEEELRIWVESLKDKTHDLSQRLYANSHNLEIVLEKMGLQTTRKVEDGIVTYSISRVRGLSRRLSRSKENVSGSSTLLTSSQMIPPAPKIPDPTLLHWVSSQNNDDDYRLFIQEVYIDYDIFRQVVGDRFGDVEKIARKYHSEVKLNREKIRQLEQSVRHRLALSQFKVGDLILFLPTRDVVRSPNPWAAFNINCPHYFLDPENASELGNREFLIGRATAIVQHKVQAGDTGDKNPFNLPEGLRWNMITAQWK